jgi:4-aminobutyrate aminotransferase/4-aminobutyrate aminotransferase/(S)-3-amino-2-methylpropionate transaminase
MAAAADRVIERGQGAYLYDSTGAPLLDAVSGYGVASLGHSHPRWVQAVTEQARRLAVTPLHTLPLAQYLRELATVLPERVRTIALTTTGAEAVELATRLAQVAQGRAGILTFQDGFHGKTAAVRYTRDLGSPEAGALAPSWLHSAPFPACQSHDAVSYDCCDESVSEDIGSIAVRAELSDIAAVLAEPILGTSGNIPPKLAFLRHLRALCDERGWLLILDESITGFGRTGDLFAFQRFGIEPDILVLSKGLGGGFPLSAVCAAPELWERSQLDSASATSSSYGGNPLACAAGSATLEIITSPGFLEQVQATAAHAAVRLRELAGSSSLVARPRGVGLMLGFDLVVPETGELMPPRACEAVFRECRDRGALVAATVPRVRLSPPLTWTTTEVDLLFDILEAAVR